MARKNAHGRQLNAAISTRLHAYSQALPSHIMNPLVVRAVSASLVLVLFGCDPGDEVGGDDTEQDDTDTDDDAMLAAQCAKWKDAYCDWRDECANTPVSQCEPTVSPVKCWSGAPLKRCISELQDGCANTPVGCKASNIANTLVAQTECETFIRSFCKNAASCTGEDAVFCEFNAPIDCSTAYAVSAQYQSCVALLDSGACSNSGLPSVCTGVILIE